MILRNQVLMFFVIHLVEKCCTGPCDRSPCLNGGTCIEYGKHRRVCSCKAGYTGRQCRINIDECKSIPCQNGGTCHDSENEYICNCPSGFSGPQCNQRKGEGTPPTCTASSTPQSDAQTSTVEVTTSSTSATTTSTITGTIAKVTTSVTSARVSRTVESSQDELLHSERTKQLLSTSRSLPSSFYMSTTSSTSSTVALSNPSIARETVHTTVPHSEAYGNKSKSNSEANANGNTVTASSVEGHSTQYGVTSSTFKPEKGTTTATVTFGRTDVNEPWSSTTTRTTSANMDEVSTASRAYRDTTGYNQTNTTNNQTNQTNNQTTSATRSRNDTKDNTGSETMISTVTDYTTATVVQVQAKNTTDTDSMRASNMTTTKQDDPSIQSTIKGSTAKAKVNKSGITTTVETTQYDLLVQSSSTKSSTTILLESIVTTAYEKLNQLNTTGSAKNGTTQINEFSAISSGNFASTRHKDKTTTKTTKQTNKEENTSNTTAIVMEHTTAAVVKKETRNTETETATRDTHRTDTGTSITADRTSHGIFHEQTTYKARQQEWSTRTSILDYSTSVTLAQKTPTEAEVAPESSMLTSNKRGGISDEMLSTTAIASSRLEDKTTIRTTKQTNGNRLSSTGIAMETTASAAITTRTTTAPTTTAAIMNKRTSVEVQLSSEQTSKMSDEVFTTIDNSNTESITTTQTAIPSCPAEYGFPKTAEKTLARSSCTRGSKTRQCAARPTWLAANLMNCLAYYNESCANQENCLNGTACIDRLGHKSCLCPAGQQFDVATKFCQAKEANPGESCANGESCQGGSICGGITCTCPTGTVLTNSNQICSPNPCLPEEQYIDRSCVRTETATAWERANKTCSTGLPYFTHQDDWTKFQILRLAQTDTAYDQIWIGMQYNQQIGNYTYSNRMVYDSKVHWAEWPAGTNPDRTNGNCVVSDKNHGYSWEFVDCNTENKYSVVCYTVPSYCPVDGSWPRTVVGSVESQSCPDGSHGYYRRKCQNGSIWANPTTTCSANPNSSCTYGETCLGGSICLTVQGFSGESCQCAPGYKISGKLCTQIKSYVGESCVSGEICAGNSTCNSVFCECASSMISEYDANLNEHVCVAKPPEKSYVNEPCSNGQICMGGTNCTGGLCLCSAGYEGYLNPSTGKNECTRSKAAINESCASSELCQGSSFCEPLTRLCTCRNGTNPQETPTGKACVEDVTCPEGTQLISEKCVKINSLPNAWEYMQKQCGNSFLVTKRKDEWDEFQALRLKEIASNPSYENIWIGLIYNISTERYEWADGTIVDLENHYFPFSKNPSLVYGKCVQSLIANNYTWTFGLCSDTTILGVCYTVPARCAHEDPWPKTQQGNFAEVPCEGGVKRRYCQGGAVWQRSYDGRQCKAYFNQSCAQGQICQNNSLCMDQNQPRCLCQYGKAPVLIAGRTVCDQAPSYVYEDCSFGQRCMAESVCDGKYCQCPFGTTAQFNTSSGNYECAIAYANPGMSCAQGETCLGGSSCESSICKCPEGEKNYGNGQCVLAVAYPGQSCAERERCLEGAACVNSVCECPIGKVAKQNATGYYTCEPADAYAQESCAHGQNCLGNTKCADNKTCLCPSGKYEFFDSTLAKNICLPIPVYVGESCADGQFCLGRSVCDHNGICMCSSGTVERLSVENNAICLQVCTNYGDWLNTTEGSNATVLCTNGVKTRYCETGGNWATSVDYSNCIAYHDESCSNGELCQGGTHCNKLNICNCSDGKVYDENAKNCLLRCPAEGTWTETNENQTAAIRCTHGQKTRKCSASGIWLNAEVATCTADFGKSCANGEHCRNQSTCLDSSGNKECACPAGQHFWMPTGSCTATTSYADESCANREICQGQSTCQGTLCQCSAPLIAVTDKRLHKKICVTSPCPSGTEVIEEACVSILPTTSAWARANQQCNDSHGYGLAVIKHETDWNKFQTARLQMQQQDARLEKIWLGMRADSQNASGFVYADQTVYDPSNDWTEWPQGTTPNTTAGNCLSSSKFSNYTWQFTACNDHSYLGLCYQVPDHCPSDPPWSRTQEGSHDTQPCTNSTGEMYRDCELAGIWQQPIASECHAEVNDPCNYGEQCQGSSECSSVPGGSGKSCQCGNGRVAQRDTSNKLVCVLAQVYEAESCAYGQLCQHNSSCDMATEICTCNPGKHAQLDETSGHRLCVADGAQPTESCLYDQICQGGSSCENWKCECPPGKEASLDPQLGKKICVRAKSYATETCEHNELCMGGSTCANTVPRSCQCPNGHVAAMDESLQETICVHGPECGDGEQFVNGNCLLLSNKTNDWEQARALCVDENNMLAMPRNEEGWILLKQALLTRLPNNQKVFIGLRYNVETNNFQWADGSNVQAKDYFPFNSSADRSSGNCITAQGPEYTWVFDDCENPFDFFGICYKVPAWCPNDSPWKKVYEGNTDNHHCSDPSTAYETRHCASGGYWQQPDSSSCYAYVNESCQYNQQCQGESICKEEDQGIKICKCPVGKVESTDVSQKQICIPTDSYFGESCANNENCQGNTVCDGTTCQCKAGDIPEEQYQAISKRVCIRATANAGESCAKQETCLGELICDGTICKCPVGQKPGANNTCLTVYVHPTESCANQEICTERDQP